MKYIIKIKKSSIKKNPNAGNTVSHVARKREISFKYYGVPQDWYDDNRVSFTSMVPTSMDSEIYNTEGILIVNDSDLITKMHKSGATISVSQDVHPIYHNPENDKLFVYEDTVVECEHCGAAFNYDKLEYDELGEEYSNTVCPRCGGWGCCEIEFEEIDNLV